MIVLSLFDGMSCGRIALERAGIKVTKYFASEIDKNAIKVSKANWNDIVHIGDVTKVSYKDGVLYTANGEYCVGKVDLLIAGSPCQGFSMAGKQLAFDDPRSKLYFEFERILSEVRKNNPQVKFLLENVRMKEDHKNAISFRLGVLPIAINSNLVSAQNRYRLYWTNIDGVVQPANKNINLKDVLDGWKDSWKIYTKKNASKPKANQNKAGCLTAGKMGDTSDMDIIVYGDVVPCSPSGRVRSKETEHSRRYTPEESERLQTVPVGYTNHVSSCQRYTMLGNGWTVDVIAHIFEGIKSAQQSQLAA
jgi:site-specific DNA-cytosine methylase